MEEPRMRISDSTMYLMIGTVILCDLVGAIPVVQWIPGLAKTIGFPLWFNVHGVSYFHKKNRSMVGVDAIALILGAIPVVGNVLPELTVSVIRNILFIRRQDKKALAEWQNQQENQNVERQKAATERYRQFQAQKEGQNNPPPNRRVDSIRPPAA